MQKSNLKDEMLREASLIIESINWIESQLEQKFTELDAAVSSENDSDIERIKKEILLLVKKLNQEEKNMDDYMIKYRKLVDDEKKKMLYNPKQKN